MDIGLWRRAFALSVAAIAITGGPSAAQVYHYDNLGRLISVERGATGSKTHRVYGYDEANNRLSVSAGLGIGNLPPDAANDEFTIGSGAISFTLLPLVNDSDPNGDALTIVSVTSRATFTSGGAGAGSVYTPNGTDLVYVCDGSPSPCDNPNGSSQATLEYTVSDPSGATSLATAVINR